MADKLKMESQSIDFIPLSKRHGKASDLFFVWFGANAELPVVAVGTISIVQGFSLWWACVAVFIGCLIGAIFMAYHSAQGPKLGLPQMIQSRAQFGFYGASWPLVVVVVMYIGYFATGGVLGGEAVASLLGIPTFLGIIIMSAACLLLALYGYDLIHRVERYMTYFFLAFFVVFTVVMVHTFTTPTRLAVHVAALTSGTFQLGPFLLALMFSATTQLAYAPYVADYSRYLPNNTSVKKTFWYTYVGINLSGIWLMILGAVMQQHIPTGNPVQQMTIIALHVGIWFKVVTLLAIALGILSINTLDIYGAYMSSLTIVNSLAKTYKPKRLSRAAFITAVAVAW